MIDHAVLLFERFSFARSIEMTPSGSLTVANGKAATADRSAAHTKRRRTANASRASAKWIGTKPIFLNGTCDTLKNAPNGRPKGGEIF